MTDLRDRNFDDLAERFSTRIYGKLKGALRHAVLWRDLNDLLPKAIQGAEQQLEILDVGGGLGQFAIALAQKGHRVHFNDLSSVMTEKAKAAAREAGVEHLIKWTNEPYQSLCNSHGKKYDLILCHAVLEWLAEPEQLLPNLSSVLDTNGTLSLCFYNPAGRTYRNLIFGNFRVLSGKQPAKPDNRSLTPCNPRSLKTVRQWLEECHFTIKQESGIRVFSDYASEARGGHHSTEDVIEMELEYSTQEPYKWLGRYLHIIAQIRDT